MPWARAEPLGLFPEACHDLQAVGQGRFGLVELAAGADLDQFVEPHDADGVDRIAGREIGAALPIHGQHGQRPRVAQGQELLDKGPLLQMGLDRQRHEPVEEGKELGVVVASAVADARQIEGDVLNRGAAPPGGMGVLGSPPRHPGSRR